MAPRTSARRGPMPFTYWTEVDNFSISGMVAGDAVTNFMQALFAVLAGNAAYFLLMPYLPLAARHVPFRTDLGLLVDACFCLFFLVAVKLVSGRKRQS